MVRKHGWLLPFHTFQVIAITVFCLLVVAFYAFFAPFVGGRIWEYVLLAAYSTVALLVFILYVRSTAINPADPGIMSKFDSNIANNHNLKLELLTKSKNLDEHGNGADSSPSTASRSSITGANSSRRGSAREETRTNMQLEPHLNKRPWLSFGGIFCALFVIEDCCNRDGSVEQQDTGEDALYCTLCEAEVRKFSKHCRSCDKCVDGFDHHCRWLNNCVGRKNYITFISLMATSLIWLVIEVGVGLAVFVRCFVDRKSMEALIVDRLGNGFSRAPFATVVAVCTAVSMLACVPLGELFFFHMILIRKGITTYEYVVAMRAMSEAPEGGSVDEEMPNILHSPTGSATTGFSGGSSLGLQYKGAWCTPPRVFVDYQEEVVPHLEPGMVPSTIDPDAAGYKQPKKPVKISAWKLAKLDSTEAMRAAAKARASSSVLRPVDNPSAPNPERSSSGNISIRSSVSTDTGITRDTNKNDFRNSVAPSQASRDEYETGTQTASSFSSPSHVHESVTLSPLPQARGLSHFSASGSKPGLVQGFDEKIMQRGVKAEPVKNSAPAQAAQPQHQVQVQAQIPATSLLRDVTRTSVVWDQEAGRYVSVPISATEARNKSTVQMGGSNFGRRSGESSSSVLKPPLEQSEKLTYTDSIFFGGPLLSVPVRNNNSAFQGQERSGLSLPKETRFKRDYGSNQLPVFVPGGSEQNPILKRDS